MTQTLTLDTVWQSVLRTEAADHGRAHAAAEKATRRLLADYFPDYAENSHLAFRWWAARVEALVDEAQS